MKHFKQMHKSSFTLNSPADERWQVAQRVAASPYFQKSPKLRDFLLYVCEKTLKDCLEEVREQQIGAKVFGRRPDYNASEDNIVRVEARELRKRLETYFSVEGKDEPIVIRIPKGGYVPTFECRESSAPMLISPAPSAEAQTSIRTVRAETSLDEPSASGRSAKHYVQILSAVLVILSIAGVWLWRENRSLRRELRSKVESAALLRPQLSAASDSNRDHSFYLDLLRQTGADAPRDTLLVLSNPSVLLYFGSNKKLPDGVGAKQTRLLTAGMRRALESFLGGPSEDYAYQFLRFTNDAYTGMGESVAAYHVGRLLQLLHLPVRITQGRFLTWESVRKENLIVLGSPHINSWTRQNLAKANFGLRDRGVENFKPQFGERPYYETIYDPLTGNVLEDYGFVSRLTSPSGATILVLAGRTSFGTFGVGEFFASPEKMRPAFEKLKALNQNKKPLSDFQILIRIKVRDNIPIDSSYETCRILSAPNLAP